ncbi:MAG: HAMP domain-containing protein [Verrucomicrobia bacterium]|nr:HAMP domain-containing protein [Verrucomicrobiota bacterium]
MLRTRIFLNLIPFVGLLVAVGVYAIILFSRLASEVNRTVTNNYNSASAAASMGLALSRMDTALQRAINSDAITARQMFEANFGVFEENLRNLKANEVMADRSLLLTQLSTNFTELRISGSGILNSFGPRQRRQIYDDEIVTRTPMMSSLIEQIRIANQDNIVTTGKQIQHVTRSLSSFMIAGLVVAVFISFFASYKLGKAILRPIQTLTNAAREIGQGKLNLTVPVLSSDELGELATTFNNMAAQLNLYREGTTEQIVRLHRTMEAALASFSDPIFIIDRMGRIELKNRAAQELGAQLGLDSGLPPRLHAAADEVLHSGKDFLPDSFKEVLTFRVKGEEKSFLPRIHMVREADTKPVGVAVVLHDVTRFRLLDDAKTNLVNTVSHELKTPLTSVRMVHHLLLEKSLGSLNKKQEELLETARKDSERLLKMLDALLDIARLEAGASSLALESVSPSDLVHSIRDEVQRTITDQGLKLACEIGPSLPKVLVDRQQIGPVFHNFISNAVKHSPPSGKIEINASALTDGSVQFSVKDEGTGIPEQYQGLIFDRFFRVPGQKKRGVGLGLSIAREIVVAHGGRVGVRSEPGKGSEFYFILNGDETGVI